MMILMNTFGKHFTRLLLIKYLKLLNSDIFICIWITQSSNWSFSRSKKCFEDLKWPWDPKADFFRHSDETQTRHRVCLCSLSLSFTFCIYVLFSNCQILKYVWDVVRIKENLFQYIVYFIFYLFE